MPFKVIRDIADAKTEVVVNAANAIGWMGGFFSKWFRFRGVSQRLNYVTKGKLHKLAKDKVQDSKVEPGDVFTTEAVYPLRSKVVCHAVTMKLPGHSSSCSLEVVESCIIKLIDYCYENTLRSITLPLLGCGTGGLDEVDVLVLYDKHFSITELDVTIAHPTLRLYGGI